MLVHLAEFYSSDFSRTYLMALDIHLKNNIVDMRSNDVFLELKRIGDLTRKMVETKKDVIYPLVYLLMKLVLTLLVATEVVMRIFPTMKYVKNQLHNRMGDKWINDCLAMDIENDVFDSIENETIITISKYKNWWKKIIKLNFFFGVMSIYYIIKLFNKHPVKNSWSRR